jgi:hypothetical protein
MTCPSGPECRWVPYVGVTGWEMCDLCLIERQVYAPAGTALSGSYSQSAGLGGVSAPGSATDDESGAV